MTWKEIKTKINNIITSGEVSNIIITGHPGTGKTTTLLNEVDNCLKQTDPDKIGYFSFTQKAAYEARDRAMDKFNLSEDDLPYFRTLHSLAFRKLGIKKENVIILQHYKLYNKGSYKKICVLIWFIYHYVWEMVKFTIVLHLFYYYSFYELCL